MERFRRFAVTALGVVTLSAAVGLPQHPGARPTPRNGQTTPAVTWHFDSLPVGQPPAGFSFGRTGYRFPVAAALSPSFTDGSVSVKCKPVSGHVDQACGLAFRYQDENNYCLTRANALEDNVRFYYVKSGRRIQLANWSGKVTAGVWHELRGEFQGGRVGGDWDGTKRIGAPDRPFRGPARLRRWAKADT